MHAVNWTDQPDPWEVELEEADEETDDDEDDRDATSCV